MSIICIILGIISILGGVISSIIYSKFWYIILPSAILAGALLIYVGYLGRQVKSLKEENRTLANRIHYVSIKDRNQKK